MESNGNLFGSRSGSGPVWLDAEAFAGENVQQIFFRESPGDDSAPHGDLEDDIRAVEERILSRIGHARTVPESRR